MLKPGKRALVGIGDNREHCFMLPVSFEVIVAYMQDGLVLEELVRASDPRRVTGRLHGL